MIYSIGVCLESEYRMPQAKKTGTSDGYTMQQVKLAPEVHLGIKLMSDKVHGPHMSDVYGEAIRWFLDFRAKKKFHYYLASPSNGKYTSMWIESDLVERCKIIAARDSTNVSRILYTAFVLYLETKKII